MGHDSKLDQVDNAAKRIEDRMKELEDISSKGNEQLKILQGEIAEKQRHSSQIRDELIRIQGAYAELKSQLPLVEDKKKEEK